MNWQEGCIFSDKDNTEKCCNPSISVLFLIFRFPFSAGANGSRCTVVI